MIVDDDPSEVAGEIDDSDTVIIELDSVVLGQKKLIQNLRTIPSNLITFLENVIDTANHAGKYTSSGTVSVTRKSVLAHCQSLKVNGEKKRSGSSPALFSRRIGALIAIVLPNKNKVCTLSVHYKSSSRERLHHYIVSDLTGLVSLPQIKPEKQQISRRTKSIVNVQKELFRSDDSYIFLDGHTKLNVHWHQQIFNGFLDTAMRMSHKDKRKVIDVVYRFKGKPLYIRATCSTDENSGIAVLTDQRAMRPLIAFCKKQISYRRESLRGKIGDMYTPSMIPNHFRLDIHDLCSMMGMKPLSENIDIAVSMMRRLADTTFKVDARENGEFQKTFSIIWSPEDRTSDTFEFRFLQNLDISHETNHMEDLFGNSAAELRPRFYTFTLEPRLFYSLVLDESPLLYISHADLAKEQSGITQRFYNWARGWVSGRNKPGLNNKWYEIHAIYTILTPAARFDNFRRHFIAALLKFEIKQDSAEPTEISDAEIQLIKFDGPSRTKKEVLKITSRIYGYYVHYEKRPEGEFLRFDRDPNDPIVGNNSIHNIRVRENLIEDHTYNHE